MTTQQIVKTISALTDRVNDLTQRLDACMNMMHDISTSNIETNANGIDGLAGTIEEQNIALNDIALTVAELEK